MKYERGTKVRVRKDLKVNSYYDEVLFVPDMDCTKGKEVTILIEFEDGKYRIEENDWTYSAEMFESQPFEKGDIVRLNPEISLGNFTKNSNFMKLLLSPLKDFTIKETKEDKIILEGSETVFDPTLFVLIKRPEKVREITTEEIENLYGCKIRIINNVSKEILYESTK